MHQFPFEKRGFCPVPTHVSIPEDDILAALGPKPEWVERARGVLKAVALRYVDVTVGPHRLWVERSTGICRDLTNDGIVAWFRNSLWERHLYWTLRGRAGKNRGDIWEWPKRNARRLNRRRGRWVQLIVHFRGDPHPVALFEETGLAWHQPTGHYLAWLAPERIAAIIDDVRARQRQPDKVKGTPTPAPQQPLPASTLPPDS